MDLIRKDRYEVRSYDTDFQAKLTLPKLCLYFQETAWKHSEDLGVGFTHLTEQNMTWVLYKLMIDMVVWPKWGDVIEIHTWPSGMDKLMCYREFRIYLNGELIGNASSSWIVIDFERRRPVRTSKYYNSEIVNSTESYFGDALARKMVNPESYATSSIEKVKLQHIDVNNHVSNACYPTWCLSYFSPEFISTHKLRTVEMQFVAEALYEQALEVKIETRDSDTYHLIEFNGKELFKMKLGWIE